MVKSGLDEDKISKTEIPRVSQYRLAAHLSLAFLLYAGLIWCALSQFIPRPKVGSITGLQAIPVTLSKVFISSSSSSRSASSLPSSSSSLSVSGDFTSLTT